MATHEIRISTWGPNKGTQEITLSTSAALRAADPALQAQSEYEATISSVKVYPDGSPETIGEIKLDRQAWARFRAEADVREFLNDARGAGFSGLKSAVEAQVNWMTNHYSHDACETEWDDPHSCACDDECPECGTAISPDSSTEHFMLTESDEHPGLYGLAGGRAAEKTHAGPATQPAASTLPSPRPHP
ncbi:hypothetical protein ABIC83_002513 [Roseateles asaccharophilus]|uniref:hypothetical protein n=1 Tax=Roseateles asaccharophilus TaxID=582607 RepID=UPI0038327B0D